VVDNAKVTVTFTSRSPNVPEEEEEEAQQ